MLAFVFLVSAIDDILLVELTEEELLLASFRYLDVCSSIVLEEEILVLGVFLNPLAELRVVEERKITLGFEVSGVVANEHLFEVGVVKNIWGS